MGELIEVDFFDEDYWIDKAFDAMSENLYLEALRERNPLLEIVRHGEEENED